MESYREIREVLKRADRMQRFIRDAILADDIREMITLGGSGLGEAENVQAGIDRILDGDVDARSELPFLQAAKASIANAIIGGQKVGLGMDALQVRDRLVDFKTHADFVSAYLRGALGFEEE